MSKHFSKFEDEIISAVSVSELLEIKKQIESTHLSDEHYERLSQLIEWSLEEFQ